MADGHALKITVELVEALDAVLGSTLSTPEPIVLLSRYIDTLAKSFGLSENQNSEKVTREDPLERAQRELPEAAAELIRHFLPESGANDADGVRDRLYTVFVELSGEAGVRRHVDDVLKLAQIYWCLERSAARSRLPIPAAQPITIGGRTTTADIKVPGANDDFATMTWTGRTKVKGAYSSSSGGLRKQGALLAVLAAKHIIDGTPTAPPDLGNAVLERSLNETGKPTVSIVWPDDEPGPATPDPLGSDHRSVVEQGPARTSMSTITSRARAYFAIDNFEQDLRRSIERFLLDHLPPEDVFGAEYDRLCARQAQDDVSGTGALAQYLYPQQAHDVLLRHTVALPAELADVLQLNLSAFDGFAAVRNRVIHGRPLQPDDLDETESLLGRFRSQFFPQTRSGLDNLASEPDWQPRPRAGSAPIERILHNLPSPDFDETGLLGREEQIDDIVSKLKRRRERMFTLVGEGGIGKTALALEACYRLADEPEPPFEAILWTSLKSEELTPAGIQGSSQMRV